MTNMKKRALILGTVLALSYCQGRQASVFDPTRGSNYMTAQQYLNTPVSQGSYLPSRAKEYNYVYSQADYQRCAQEGINANNNQGTVSDLCNQLFWDDYYRSGMPQYYGNNIPEQFTFNFQNPGSSCPNCAGGGSYTMPMRNWANANQPFISGHAGFYPNYRTPVNMGSFCGNTGDFTNMQYSTPCGSLNYWYSTYNLQNNQAYNSMLNGNINAFPQTYGNNGTFATQLPGLYSGVIGYYQGTLTGRDVVAENATVRANVRTTWSNLKALPANALGKLEITGMNIAGSIVDRLVSQLEAHGSNIVARNSTQVGYNQALTDNNYRMASLYTNMMLPMATATTVLAANPDEGTDCELNSFHYEVNPDVTNGTSYKVECPNK